MCDDDQKDVVEGERPKAAPPFREQKTPIRGRAARGRNATQELAFTIFQAISNNHPPQVQLSMLRVKLLAWAAIYGTKVMDNG